MAQVKQLSMKFINGLRTNCYYVRGERGSILVDTGTSRNAKEILDWFSNEEIDLKEIKAIFLTHVHIDHAGGISEIAKYIGDVSVAVHKEGIECLQKGVNSSLRPSSFRGLMQKPLAYLLSRFPPYNPDIIIEDEIDLDEMGIDGVKAIFTPGHTPESISLIVREEENTIAIVGDLLTRSILPPKRPIPSVFIYDRNKWKESLRRLLWWQPPIQTFYTGHYGPFHREVLLQQFQRFL